MQINKNKQVGVQLPTYADNVALPAFARRCCSNLMPAGPQQQTCSSAFAAAGPCWDRQTGGHGTVFIDLAPHNARAVQKSNPNTFINIRASDSALRLTMRAL